MTIQSKLFFPPFLLVYKSLPLSSALVNLIAPAVAALFLPSRSWGRSWVSSQICLLWPSVKTWVTHATKPEQEFTRTQVKPRVRASRLKQHPDRDSWFDEASRSLDLSGLARLPAAFSCSDGVREAKRIQQHGWI